MVALWTPPVRVRQCPQSRPPTPARSTALANRLRDARIHRETRRQAHGFPGCSHSHTQPLAAGHISVIGHHLHRIYLLFFSSLV